MGDKNKKMCAFPHVNGFGGDQGMTLRDYFAAKAMQSLLTSQEGFYYWEEVPAQAYRIADKMMEDRSK
jgi:hypothetical protein